MGKGYFESVSTGRAHQAPEQCVRLNSPFAALEGLLSPQFCTMGCLHAAPGALHGCSHPVQPCAEGSRCLCEMEITALLIYKAPLRYQND